MSAIVQPALLVNRGKVKEPSWLCLSFWFFPFLHNFFLLHFRILAHFCSTFPQFLPKFFYQGRTLYPLCPMDAAYANAQVMITLRVSSTLHFGVHKITEISQDHKYCKCKSMQCTIAEMINIHSNQLICMAKETTVLQRHTVWSCLNAICRREGPTPPAVCCFYFFRLFQIFCKGRDLKKKQTNKQTKQKQNC